MNSNIKLSNNYYLKVNTDIENNFIDVNKINIASLLKNKKMVLKIDFNSLKNKDYKKILKKLLKIKNVISFFNINVGIDEENKKILGYVINYNEDDEKQKDFLLAINAIFFNTRYERYNYIYDTVCEYLDSYFYEKNLCDFKNNKCGEKKNTSSTTGCCHHFKYKALGPLSKLVLCEYLKDDYTCGAKCISCKLFTCDYLEKKGIKFRIKDILLLDTFFNPIQKYYIKYMVFTPKEKILKKLMRL